jgi:flagellar biosynthesis GTPase FlhF
MPEETGTTEHDEETGDVEETTTTTTDPKPSGRDKAIAEERRKARAAEKRAADLEAKLSERDRKDAEAEGRWQEIAEQEREKAESLERQIADRERRDSVTAAARGLRFKNPDLAFRLLDESDTSEPEAALRRLAKQEPYLTEDAPARTGAGVTGTATTEDPLAHAGLGVLDAIERSRGRA